MDKNNKCRRWYLCCFIKVQQRDIKTKINDEYKVHLLYESITQVK